MSARRKAENDLRPYAVYAGTSFTIVMAASIDEARKTMLVNMDLERKPWLARDWRIHRASREERDRYVALADNLRRSQPSASAAKRPRATTADRLSPSLFD